MANGEGGEPSINVSNSSFPPTIRDFARDVNPTVTELRQVVLDRSVLQHGQIVLISGTRPGGVVTRASHSKFSQDDIRQSVTPEGAFSAMAMNEFKIELGAEIPRKRLGTPSKFTCMFVGGSECDCS